MEENAVKITKLLSVLVILTFISCVSENSDEGSTQELSNGEIPYGNDFRINPVPQGQNTNNNNSNNNNSNNNNNNNSGSNSSSNTGSNIHPYYQQNPIDPDPTPPTDPPPVFQPKVDMHLKYFGYYWSGITEKPISIHEDGESFTEGDEEVNYIDEHQDHTNITWLYANFRKFKENMDLAKFYGHKVVIDLAPIIFRDQTGQARGLYYHEDYDHIQSALATWWQTSIVDAGYEDMVAMLVPVDEPYHHFVDDGFLGFGKSEKDIKKLNRHLDKIGEIIKFVTGRKIGVSLSPSFVINRNARLGRIWDYLGFYCYDNMNDCASKRTWYGAKIHYTLQDLINHLELKTYGGSQLWFLIGPAFISHTSKRPATPPELVQRFNDMYNVAKNNRRVFGLFPFIWRSYREGENLQKLRTGARDIPLVKDRMIQIGKEIIED